MAGQSDTHVSLFSPEEGKFGPFMPQIASQVPLWLSLALKKCGKCSIQSPQWMLIDNLIRVLEGERDSHGFQPLPLHYMEISKILFDQAHDDISDIYVLRSLMEDIRNVRSHKVETEMENFSGAYAVTGTNISAIMEVNIVRLFVGQALQAFYRCANQELMPDVDRTSDRQP